MKLNQYFYLAEFVPEEIFDIYGRKSIWFVSDWQILIATAIRKRYEKPLVINDWMWGGKLQNRGTRSPFSNVGAPWSQHKMKAAIDFNVMGMSPQELFEDMPKWHFIKLIGATEDIAYTPTWSHIDNRKRLTKDIHIVRPNLIKPQSLDYEIPEYYNIVA